MVNQKKIKKISSFTIIEAIIVIGVFVLLTLMVFGWQKDIFYLQALFQTRLSTQENIRKTIKNFIAEVRTAQPSESGSYPLERVDKDNFIFYSDIDADGIKERVRYFLQDKKIKKGVIEPTGQPPVYDPNNEVLTELVPYIINANDEIFTYFDKNYDGNSPPLQQPVNVLVIRLVKITIMVDEDANRPPGPITETSQVSIRNLKDNL